MLAARALEENVSMKELIVNSGNTCFSLPLGANGDIVCYAFTLTYIKTEDPLADI